MWFSDFTMLDDGVKTTLAEDSPFRTYADINLRPIDPDPRVPVRFFPRLPLRSRRAIAVATSKPDRCRVFFWL